MEVAATEKVFFDAHGIKVTNARFIVNKQTYAMASVNSVKVGFTDLTPPKTGSIILSVLGGLVLLSAFGNLRQHMQMAFGGAVMLGIGIMWFRSIKPKFEYKLILTTSSGETTALTSNSEADIRVVEAALNNSIIHRG